MVPGLRLSGLPIPYRRMNTAFDCTTRKNIQCLTHQSVHLSKGPQIWCPSRTVHVGGSHIRRLARRTQVFTLHRHQTQWDLSTKMNITPIQQRALNKVLVIVSMLTFTLCLFACSQEEPVEEEFSTVTEGAPYGSYSVRGYKAHLPIIPE